MGKSKFKFGDRVTVISLEQLDMSDNIHIGDTGTVVSDAYAFKITDGITQSRYSVEFDRYIHGHDGYIGRGARGRCWNINEDNLAHVSTCSEEELASLFTEVFQ